ncbi:MAG TPA: hypothetical protein PKD83_00330 [Ignavibacteria bacterium]|nr:hypothetical protein [Ignavibacteria bacterium]
MLTILALEIFNSVKQPKQFKASTVEENSNENILSKLNEEQILREKREKIEFFIEILPVLILAAGIIVMYILGKIYLE